MNLRMASCLTLTTIIAASTANAGPIAPLPADVETTLALSALPPHLRDGATVLTLNPQTGFEVAKAGTNGFTAFVARNDYVGLRQVEAPGDYTDDFLIPISFDAEGSRTILPYWTDAARLQASGTPQPELERILVDRIASGYYEAPKRGGISYMLSPIMRAYLQPGKAMTMPMPHYMFYAPGVVDADIGGLPNSPFPFMNDKGPHAVIIKTEGEMETKKILEDNAALLAQLCNLRAEFCLPADAMAH